MMKVAFIASGNALTESGLSPIILNQGRSLEKNGIIIEYYGIKGKGIHGYIKNIKKIREFLIRGNFDIIHSHYSLSSFIVSVASVGLKIPQVSSLMGSDIQTNTMMKGLIMIFSKFIWKKTIVKSEIMKEKLSLNNCNVIPNGVDLDEFVPDDQLFNKKKVSFDINKKQIVWVSNPSRYEKNFELAKKSVGKLNNHDVELIVVSGKIHSKVKEYMLASDMLLLTSRWEGSPNVIKEAMALNIPIVTTDVGDVKDIIKDTVGCYIVSHNSDELAKAIKKCLDFGKRTDGRGNLYDFDSKSIAQKIINLYYEIL